MAGPGVGGRGWGQKQPQQEGEEEARLVGAPQSRRSFPGWDGEDQDCGLPSALAPTKQEAWCSEPRQAGRVQGVGRGTVRAQGKAAPQGAGPGAPCLSALPPTHPPTQTASPAWGLTKRLFSKTLSLESESKSL